MTQEALKLALEGLEEWRFGGDPRAADKYITAIKEALAQTQEPVAWVSEDVCEGQYIDGRPRKIWWECEKGVGTAFYTTPPQRTWVDLTDEEIDFHLDKILKAAGSALKHYSMQKTKDDMRQALREALV